MKLTVSVLNVEEHTSSCSIEVSLNGKDPADWVHRIQKTFKLLCPLRDVKFDVKIGTSEGKFTVKQLAEAYGFDLDGVKTSKHKPMKLRRACSRFTYLLAALVKRGWTCNSFRKAISVVEAGAERKPIFKARVKNPPRQRSKNGYCEAMSEEEFNKNIKEFEKMKPVPLKQIEELRTQYFKISRERMRQIRETREVLIRMKKNVGTLSRAVMHCAFFFAKNHTQMDEWTTLNELECDKKDRKYCDERTIKKWVYCFSQLRTITATTCSGKARDFLPNYAYEKIKAIATLNQEKWLFASHLDAKLEELKKKEEEKRIKKSQMHLEGGFRELKERYRRMKFMQG